jgi:hypothetical protein
MTQDRNQPSQGGTYPGGAFPSSTSVPGDQRREPWDPRREPTGAPMPWEKDRKVQPPQTDPDSKPKSKGGLGKRHR